MKKCMVFSIIILRKCILICLFIFGIIQSAYSQSFNPGIMLTFDDKYIDEWYDLLPIFDQYNTKATFFVTDIEWISSSQTTKLITLQNNGHEIAGHGYDHLDAPAYIQSHSEQEYIDVEIVPLLDYFANNSLVATSFAYPHGSRDSDTDALLFNYFQFLRGVTYSWEGYDVVDNIDCYISAQNIENDLIYGIGIDHIEDNDFTEITAGILKAKNENLIIVLYSHKPSDSGDDYTIRPTYLDSILDYANNLNMSFYTVSDIIQLREDLALPVELTSFTASAYEQQVILNWSTSSELNNMGYRIKRKTDIQMEYEIIDTFRDNPLLLGQGNSSSGHIYEFIDYSVQNNINYRYILESIDYDGSIHEHGPISIMTNDNILDRHNDNIIPLQFEIHQNYPNPFNMETKFKFGIPEGQNNGITEIYIYNILGQKIVTLFRGNLHHGYYTITWDGRNKDGISQNSGIYFYTSRNGNYMKTKKMIMTK